MHTRLDRSPFVRRSVGFAVLAVSIAALAVAQGSPASAVGSTTYTATQTLPVPPASNYAGSGGGDGWGIALTSTQVFNVFHHASSLTVACHEQADASSCWSPETITDPSTGSGFATSGHPGLWLDRSSEKLYVYVTRTVDSTGGVVCIDTTQAPTTANPFCGFTALTQPGESPEIGGISALSEPMTVGSSWYSMNYVSGSVTNDANSLLCFDTTTKTACSNEPYQVPFGDPPFSPSSYPEPEAAAIGTEIIAAMPTSNGTTLGCFDTATGLGCTGLWPVAASGYGSGAPFPMLSPSGSITGFCLPTGIDPCFDLSGTTVDTPAGMTSAIPSTSGWNGQSVILGPRVYVPDGNADAVDCFDYSMSASCINFPKTLPNLGLLYTVNADPARPTCLWVNSDDGSSQIQNFDAYTGAACGQGPIRVLASSFVVPTQLCEPSSYTSLMISQPAPGTYTSGTVRFEDGDANPILGILDQPLAANGSVSLSGLNLSTSTGLPQFLITINGASGAPTAVTVTLSWTGTADPSCRPKGSGHIGRYVALGDSYSAGEGAIDQSGDITFTLNPNTNSRNDQCHRSLASYPYGVWDSRTDATSFVFRACSGAVIADLVHQLSGTGQWDEGAQLDAIAPLGSTNAQTGLVTLSVGGNDAGFVDILNHCLTGFGHWQAENGCLKYAANRFAQGENLLRNGGQVITDADGSELPCDVSCASTYYLCRTTTCASETLLTIPSLAGLYKQVHDRAPNARIVVLQYPQLFPASPPGTCVVGTFRTLSGVSHSYTLSSSEMVQLNKFGATLDQDIQTAVSADAKAGIDIATAAPNTQFNTHRICDSGTPWINGLRWDNSNFLGSYSPYSFHPNAKGQVAFGSAIAPYLP